MTSPRPYEDEDLSFITNSSHLDDYDVSDAPILVSGVLNFNQRKSEPLSMTVFDDGWASFASPKRKRTMSATSAQHETESTALLSKIHSDLNTQTFHSIHEPRGIGYASRTAYNLFLPSLLFFILGFAPFAVINALWAQLSVFRNEVPEGNDIGTRIGSIYNAANIFPFIYVALAKKYEIRDNIVIPFLGFVGIGTALGLGFLWKATMEVAGHEISYILYIFSFMAGGVGCTLGVVLYSYSARYRPFATTALSFGMGISATAITGLGVLQRIGLPDCFDFQKNYYKNYPWQQPNATVTAPPFTAPAPLARIWDKSCQPGNMYQLHFPPSVFFIICASLLGMALIAFFIIDCCKGLMLPHEDADFFFRDLDQTRAEIEETKLQATRDRTQDDDEAVIIDAKTGKARFSLTEPLQTQAINEAADDHAAALLHHDTQQKQQAADERRKLFWASFGPVVDQFAKAFMVYFLTPGTTSNDSVVSVLVFVASAANMVGRISTGFITFWKLWLLNAICFACFVYEVVVAAWPGEGDFPITPWLLVPITIISSGLGGYISTQVYMSANRSCLKHFNDTAHAKDIRKYVSLANQIGMLAGTYACLGIVSAGLFSK